MTLTFYPKRLLVTALFLAIFGTMLAFAQNTDRGLSTAGLLAVLAYVLIDLVITFNPALWWRERRNRQR